MKKLITTLILLALFGVVQGQRSDKNTFLLSGYSGAVFSNDVPLSDELLIGIEGNYFVTRGISITGGVDYLSAGDGRGLIALGTRFYPNGGTFFLRHRSMINFANRFSNDFLLGIGKDFMIGDKWTVEGNLDYHFVLRGVGVRVGIGVFL